jgi:MFS family permease
MNPASPIRTLYLLSAAVWVAMTAMGIIWPLMPVYAQEMGATGLELGLIISAFPLARIVFQPFVGRISDTRGRKPILCWGLVLFAAVSILYVLASRVAELMGVRFLHGAASVLVVPVAMAMTGDMAPSDRAGLYMGTLNMAVMLGFGIGPALGGFIHQYLGMQAAFLAMGALTLLTLGGVAAMVPSDADLGFAPRGRPPLPLRSLLAHPVVRGLCLLRFASAIGQGCVYAFLPLMAPDMGLTSAQVGLLLGVNILLVAFLQRPLGALADRGNLILQILLGTGVTALAITAMPLAGGFPGLLALNALMGAGGGVAMPAGLALSARLGRSMGMGTIIGLTETGYSMGMIASPIVAGGIMDLWGLPSVFMAGGGITLAGAAGVFLYLRGGPAPAP